MAARAASALALAASACFCSSAASASAFLASACLASASLALASPPPMAPAMALPAMVPATAPTAAAPMVPIMLEPPAAGAAAAGPAAAGAAVLVAAGAAAAGAALAGVAAGAAAGAFCVAAGRDLEPPMRLAWARPGKTMPATANAITEAEVRKEGFTASGSIQSELPTAGWHAGCDARHTGENYMGDCRAISSDHGVAATDGEPPRCAALPSEMVKLHRSRLDLPHTARCAGLRATGATRRRGHLSARVLLRIVGAACKALYV